MLAAAATRVMMTHDTLPDASLLVRHPGPDGSDDAARLMPGDHGFGAALEARTAIAGRECRAVDVQIGQITNVMLSLGARGQNQTIEVTAEAPLLQTYWLEPALTPAVPEGAPVLPPGGVIPPRPDQYGTSEWRYPASAHQVMYCLGIHWKLTLASHM